jgi:hypothetical protein
VIKPTREMVRSTRRQPLTSFFEPSPNGTSNVRAVQLSCFLHSGFFFFKQL